MRIKLLFKTRTILNHIKIPKFQLKIKQFCKMIYSEQTDRNLRDILQCIRSIFFCYIVIKRIF